MSAPEKGGRIARGEAMLAWREDGDASAPALVLGNALGTELSSWDPLMTYLVRHFRVIRFDARGHGLSALDPQWAGGDYSITLLARDTLAVADAAGVKRFHYLGLSVGGMLGLWLARHEPDRLDRLVVSNTAARLPPEVWVQRIEQVRASGLSALVDSTMQRWFTPDFHGQGQTVIDATRSAFLRVDVRGYLGCAAAIRDMDLRDQLAHIRTPALVVTGGKDASTTTALGQDIVARIAGAQWFELPVAHMPQLEQPAALADAVLAFLLGR